MIRGDASLSAEAPGCGERNPQGNTGRHDGRHGRGGTKFREEILFIPGSLLLLRGHVAGARGPKAFTKEGDAVDRGTVVLGSVQGGYARYRKEFSAG